MMGTEDINPDELKRHAQWAREHVCILGPEDHGHTYCWHYTALAKAAERLLQELNQQREQS